MLILGIETSTKTSSVAVLRDNVVASEISTQTGTFHSETLVEHIAFALQAAGADRRELTGIAVDVGPGSFTGLRIGLATAKAMAYALDIPLVGVSATNVLARGLWGVEHSVYALIDAQKMSAYVEGFVFQDGELKSVEPIRIMTLKDFAAAVSEKGNVILAGDAAEKCFAGNFPANVTVAPTDKVMPRAASVALLGAGRLAQGDADDLMTLAPLYLRRSEAEILWERRHG